MKQAYRNMWRGMLLGLWIAAGLSLWALLMRLVVGTAPFEATTFSLTQTVLIYFAGFTTGGLLVGLLSPLRRWAIGSMLLGIVFTLPVYALFAATYAKNATVPSSWLGLGVLAVAVVVGGGLGLWVWSNEHRGR